MSRASSAIEWRTHRRLIARSSTGSKRRARRERIEGDVGHAAIVALVRGRRAGSADQRLRSRRTNITVPTTMNTTHTATVTPRSSQNGCRTVNAYSGLPA